MQHCYIGKTHSENNVFWINKIDKLLSDKLERGRERETQREKGIEREKREFERFKKIVKYFAYARSGGKVYGKCTYSCNFPVSVKLNKNKKM